MHRKINITNVHFNELAETEYQCNSTLRSRNVLPTTSLLEIHLIVDCWVRVHTAEHCWTEYTLLFSKVAVSVYTSKSRVWEWPLLHIFTSAWHFQSIWWMWQLPMKQVPLNVYWPFSFVRCLFKTFVHFSIGLSFSYDI